MKMKKSSDEEAMWQLEAWNQLLYMFLVQYYSMDATYETSLFSVLDGTMQSVL